jgi:hypothetical protein
LAFSGCGGEVVWPINATYEQQIVELTNLQRASRGLPPLKRVDSLDAAARYHAVDMAQDDYFDHDSYDRSGGSLEMVCGTWDRIRTYYSGAHAENIAAGHSTPESVMNAWMNSEHHRNNILSSSSWEIGVGYYCCGGEWSRYWVQNFGRRSGVYPVVLDLEAASSDSTTVGVYVYGDWSEMRLRNDAGEWTPWQPFQNSFSWSLRPEVGLRTVQVEMRDSSGGSASSSDTIYLTTAPASPTPTRTRTPMPSPTATFTPRPTTDGTATPWPEGGWHLPLLFVNRR